MKSLVYVAGAYRGKSKWWIINRIQLFFNIVKARKVAKQLWWNGVVAICPHLNTFWMDGSYDDEEVFLKGDLELLSRCQFILLLDNWETSKGAKVEYEFALTHNLEVFYQKDLEQLCEECNKIKIEEADMSEIDIKVINKSEFELPICAKKGDSGRDLKANESITIPKHSFTLIKTGLHTAIPEGFELQIRSRSGMALNNGLIVLNQPGTVDSGYRAELGVILYNVTDQDQFIEKGTRIAQIVLCPVYKINWKEVKELPSSERNLGGFGHTGTN